MIQPKKPVAKKAPKKTDKYSSLGGEIGRPTGPSGNRLAPTYGGAKNGKAIKKAKTGTSLGMKSVKAGFDNNPGVTRADFVSIGKGKAKSGAALKKQAATAIAMKKAGKTPKSMKSGGSMKKCRYGCK